MSYSWLPVSLKTSWPYQFGIPIHPNKQWCITFVWLLHSPWNLHLYGFTCIDIFMSPLLSRKEVCVRCWSHLWITFLDFQSLFFFIYIYIFCVLLLILFFNDIVKFLSNLLFQTGIDIKLLKKSSRLEDKWIKEIYAF